MMLFGFVCVGFVMVNYVYEVGMENARIDILEYMDYERNISFHRVAVVQGIFRKHNESFRKNGMNIKGNA